MHNVILKNNKQYSPIYHYNFLIRNSYLIKDFLFCCIILPLLHLYVILAYITDH